MKKNANELFDKSPDLLHHLVTIMNPNILVSNGVPIYKINQNVGEFVITFPRAYHAGFNQGFNFAEAVNFCPADWMKLGRSAIENYKLVKRHTVFSHDELVCKIATSLSLSDMNIIEEIKKELVVIIEAEKRDRWKLAEEKVFKKSSKIAFESLTDDERTCDYCKTTCFISAIYCSCSKNTLTCLNHHQHLCRELKTTESLGSPRKRSHEMTLIYRYTTDEMSLILSRLNKYTHDYDEWCLEVESILSLRQAQQGNNDLIEMNCKRIKKKPRINKVLDLMEHARLRNYPRVKAVNKVNLLAELDVEFKNAQTCADYCVHFISMYRRGVGQGNRLGSQDHSQNVDDLKAFMKVGDIMDEDIIEEIIEENSDDDVIFVKKAQHASLPTSPFLKKRISIDRLHTLVNTINTLVCEIDEQSLLIAIFNDALKFEKKIDHLISEWDIHSPKELKCAINYLNRIDIEFSAAKVEQLKCMHKQAVWLNAVNAASNNPNEFSIGMMSELVDKVMDDELLVTHNENEASKLVVENAFCELQELLSISQTWDNKAKEQINAKYLFKLEDLELTINEAKCIPAYLENVEKLVQIVKDANTWKEKVDTTLNIGHLDFNHTYPYLTELTELLDEAHSLPVKLQVNLIQMKIDIVNEWIIRVNKLFNTTKVCKTSLETSNLLEVLTPRLEINHILHKLQSKEVVCKSGGKKGKQSKSAISSSETFLNDTGIDGIQSAKEIYESEKDFILLREHMRQVELKEMGLIKKLRSFHEDALNNWKAATNSVIKCSSCYKQIQQEATKQPNSIKQCRLCLGLFHANNSCSKLSNRAQLDTSKCGKQTSSTINDYLKQEATSVELCCTCRRSKRPGLDQVLESLIVIEKLDVKSFETNALQLFVERVLNWQERYNKLAEACGEIGEICNLVEELGLDAKNAEIIKKLFNELPSLRRVELNELYVESLLLEIDIEEIRQINQLFGIVKEEEEVFSDGQTSILPTNKPDILDASVQSIDHYELINSSDDNSNDTSLINNATPSTNKNSNKKPNSKKTSKAITSIKQEAKPNSSKLKSKSCDASPATPKMKSGPKNKNTKKKKN